MRCSCKDVCKHAGQHRKSRVRPKVKPKPDKPLIKRLCASTPGSTDRHEHGQECVEVVTERGDVGALVRFQLGSVRGIS